jgi:hypothetical protein
MIVLFQNIFELFPCFEIFHETLVYQVVWFQYVNNVFPSSICASWFIFTTIRFLMTFNIELISSSLNQYTKHQLIIQLITSTYFLFVLYSQLSLLYLMHNLTYFSTLYVILDVKLDLQFVIFINLFPIPTYILNVPSSPSMNMKR